MLGYILGAVTGAIIAWLSFFTVVYPYYKRQATENAMLRDTVEQWKHQAEYFEEYDHDFDALRGGADK